MEDKENILLGVMHNLRIRLDDQAEENKNLKQELQLEQKKTADIQEILNKVKAEKADSEEKAADIKEILNKVKAYSEKKASDSQ